MPIRSILFSVALAGSAFAVAQVQIVDVVPNKFRKEHAQNSEPNISVNPANPQQIMISAFGSQVENNPIYFSNDGGTTWSVFQYTRVGDQTLAWSDRGIAYIAELSPSASRIFVGHQKNPTARRHQFRIIPRSDFDPPHGGPDQPWIDAITVDDTDRIYVAFNDLSVRGNQTAAVRFSLDNGAHWKNAHIEHGNPDGQDPAPVRVKAAGDTVYATFQRPSSFPFTGDATGDIVVVRDDNAGSDGFAALGTLGVNVATNQTIPEGSLGNERLGSDMSIAVDPSNSARVAVAFARVVSGSPRVVLALSTTSGAGWSEVFTGPAGSAMPALAIAGNGTIGLLYTKYDGANLETHLVQSKDSFSTNFELTLSKFVDGAPKLDFDPYIGDYIDLVAVGTTFYGTFSASNNVSAFPITPTFLRNTTGLGTTIPFSIDPFFFSTPAISGP